MAEPGGRAPSGDALILLVDDFEDALEMYREFLTFKGYRIITATDGAEAIASAYVHRPRLILMDIQMPRMDGTEAMRTLRADPLFDQTLIVAFTAHALDSERNAALESGFDEVIAQPCLLEDLVVAIERLLRSIR